MMKNMAKFYNMTPSRFFCTQCGREGIPVQRKKGQEREGGHLKKLYCMYCKQEVNHAEIREIGGYDIEDFKQEYNLGRFVDGNRIAIKDLLDCSCSSCPFNVNGKCWNSNWSNDCGHRVKEVDINE
jgi:hypothetical protein